MFFRRNEGQYRETDRVTRFKLVKSGKHWLRAATSHFGLFKIISGRVDASSVSVHQVEEEVPLITSDRLLKGVAATGALLGGGVATYVVQADEATSPSAVEHTVSPTTDVWQLLIQRFWVILELLQNLQSEGMLLVSQPQPQIQYQTQ